MMIANDAIGVAAVTVREGIRSKPACRSSYVAPSGGGLIARSRRFYCVIALVHRAELLLIRMGVGWCGPEIRPRLIQMSSYLSCKLVETQCC